MWWMDGGFEHRVPTVAPPSQHGATGSAAVSAVSGRWSSSSPWPASHCWSAWPTGARGGCWSGCSSSSCSGSSAWSPLERERTGIAPRRRRRHATLPRCGRRISPAVLPPMRRRQPMSRRRPAAPVEPCRDRAPAAVPALVPHAVGALPALEGAMSTRMKRFTDDRRPAQRGCWCR